jgi:hypothetical protein
VGSGVTLGSVLIAHEIAHNLGLDHVSPPPPNLMNPTLKGDFSLTAEQVQAILASPLLQADGSQLFITLTPIAVVPEPATIYFAWVAALGLAASAARRRVRCARG